MSQKVITFSFSGATRLTWVADGDYELVALQTTSTAIQVLVSTDPTLATASLTAPSSNSITFDVLAYAIGTTGKAMISGMRAPIAEGSTLVVLSGGAVTAILYLDPVVS